MIVVTTPTGAIGQQVVHRLLEEGEKVLVIVRDPSRLPEAIRTQVEVVQGSHGDSNVVDEAFKDADAVFWLIPPDPQTTSIEASYSGFTRPACEAFGNHGVKHVVGISALGRGTPWAHNAGLVTAALAMDDLIAASGVNYRALTMPSFMDNILRQIVPIRDQGMFFSPILPDLKLPTCATRDIASMATKLLIDRSWSGNGSVPVLGPEDLSWNDMARIMSDVLGKPVRFQPITMEAFKSGLLQRGTSEAMAQGVVDMYAAKNAGLDNGEQRTPANSTPTSFRQWCEEVLRPAVISTT